MELLFIIRPGAPDHGAAGNSGFVERQMVTTVFSLLGNSGFVERQMVTTVFSLFSGTWRRPPTTTEYVCVCVCVYLLRLCVSTVYACIYSIYSKP